MNENNFVSNIKNICNSNEEDFELRKGPWSLEEDNLLLQYIDACGEGRWNALAKCAGLKRTGKSCRLRWLNYLKPDIKRGNLTPQEQLLILELHSKLDNRWAKIAQNLPGRTDNEIKNYWRTRVQKQARQLNVDANSKTFLEKLKCHWMPRLLEKVEQSNSSFSTSPSSSSFSKSHEIMTLISENSKFCPKNVHQEESKLPTFSNNNQTEYKMTKKLTEIQESVMESSTMGYQEMCYSEYDITQNDCFNYEEWGTFWNTDEL